jgi:hypothetical protein
LSDLFQPEANQAIFPAAVYRPLYPLATKKCHTWGKAHALAFGDDLHHPFMVIYDDFGDGLLILGMLKIQFILGFTTGNYPIVLGIWRL